MATLYRYPWPASALSPREMSLLHSARESSTNPKATITQLLAEAVRAQYGHLATPSIFTKPRSPNDPQKENTTPTERVSSQAEAA